MLGPPPRKKGRGLRWRAGLRRIAMSEDLEILGDPPIPLLGWHTACPLLPPVLSGGVHRKEQVFEVGRPLLMLLFSKKGQLTSRWAAHTLCAHP
ncbi:MAG: hypothetical protein NVSMB38_39730 [Ktedonobacteraceae bacterium]